MKSHKKAISYLYTDMLVICALTFESVAYVYVFDWEEWLSGVAVVLLILEKVSAVVETAGDRVRPPLLAKSWTEI